MSHMPRCWNIIADWIAWQELNAAARSAPGKPLDHFCTDCTQDYKDRMVTEGRCAYPDVVFSHVIQRRRDPVTGKVVMELSCATRGWRSPGDEAAWARRYAVRVQEKADDKDGK